MQCPKTVSTRVDNPQSRMSGEHDSILQHLLGHRQDQAAGSAPTSPREEIYLDIRDYHQVIEAIRTLAIRGAPAIGVAAAMGAALGALEIHTQDGRSSWSASGNLPGNRRIPAHRGESLLGPGARAAAGPRPCPGAGAGPQGLPGDRGPGHAEGRRDHATGGWARPGRSSSPRACGS